MSNKTKDLDHLVKQIDAYTDKYVKSTGKLKGRSGVMKESQWKQFIKEIKLAKKNE